MRSAATSSRASATESVSTCLQAWARRMRRAGASKGVFVLDGARVSDAEVGGPDGLMPLIVWHADNLYRYAMGGQGLGVGFTEDAEALLGRTVDGRRLERSTAELLCFVIEAAEDARQHLPKSESVPGAVELRGLVNQFAEQLMVAPQPATPGVALAVRHSA